MSSGHFYVTEKCPGHYFIIKLCSGLWNSVKKISISIKPYAIIFTIMLLSFSNSNKVGWFGW